MLKPLEQQFHAVEGQDRLFAKPLIGHVRFDKNGNTKSAFVSVKEGVLSRYEKGPIGRQENNGMLYDNSIIYNGTKIMHGNNEEKAVEMFEFLPLRRICNPTLLDIRIFNLQTPIRLYASI